MESEEPSKSPLAHVLSNGEEPPENALRILEAALRLFAQKGYAATSVREIVQEAAVTNPMVYYYFGNKEGLFRELITCLHGGYHRDLIAAIEGVSAVDEMLRIIVAINLRALRERPEVVRFVYTVLFGPAESYPPHDLYAGHAQVVEEIAVRLQRAIDEGRFVPRGAYDGHFLARQLFGAINSHLMRVLKELARACEEETAAILDAAAGPEAVERIVSFYLHGAGNPGA